jgi:hypothetical protein
MTNRYAIQNTPDSFVQPHATHATDMTHATYATYATHATRDPYDPRVYSGSEMKGL